MPEENSSISIIPNECFKWRAGVQFVESFRTRAAALNYAFQHNCNLIVEHTQGRSSLFDVLEDPKGLCTSGIDLELLKTEEVLVEPYTDSWTRLLFLALWDLTKRAAALSARLYANQIVPFSRRAAVVAGLCLRRIAPISRRAAAVASVYLHKMAPHVRQAGKDVERVVRNGCAVMFSTGSDLARKVAVSARSHYHREVAPRCRHAASRFWWSDMALDFRRAWHRNSHGTGLDLAKRFAAIGSLYLRKAGPVSQHVAAVAGAKLQEITRRGVGAARSCRRGELEAAYHRALSSSLSTSFRTSRRLAADVATAYDRAIVPFSRRAVAIGGMCLREAVTLFLRTAAFATLYFREVTPTLRSAAVRCWSDSKNASQPQSWAVPTLDQSNPTQPR